jgi:glycerol-3-phosphate O-acyltransferase
LRPFLEAYSVVATHLVNCGDEAVEGDVAIRRCLGLGRQLLLQRRIVGPEALSAELFGAALELAAHRGLLEGGPPDLVDRRGNFLREIQEMVSLTNEVELQSRVRQSGSRVAPLPRLVEVRDDVAAM